MVCRYLVMAIILRAPLAATPDEGADDTADPLDQAAEEARDPPDDRRHRPHRRSRAALAQHEPLHRIPPSHLRHLRAGFLTEYRAGGCVPPAQRGAARGTSYCSYARTISASGCMGSSPSHREPA